MTNNEIKVESTQVSSGGFIFFIKKETNQVFVLLIKNRKGEYWIPKGKLESGEDQLSAAFREIEEEVGLSKEQIRYIDFCFLDKYTYMEGQKLLGKELYINVFDARDQYKPRSGDDEIDITGVDWYDYEKALEIISFNRNELVKSKMILDLFYAQHP